MLEKVDEVGEKPLLGAVKQMYEIKQMSQEAAVGIKQNNEKLMKARSNISDISIIFLIQMQI